MITGIGCISLSRFFPNITDRPYIFHGILKCTPLSVRIASGIVAGMLPAQICKKPCENCPALFLRIRSILAHRRLAMLDDDAQSFRVLSGSFSSFKNMPQIFDETIEGIIVRRVHPNLHIREQ